LSHADGRLQRALLAFRVLDNSRSGVDMLNGKLSLLKRGLATATAAFLIASAGIHGARADAITEWNAIAANLPIAAPVMARVMAAMHGAMHDAVNSIDPRYQHYRFSVPAPAGASIDAAAAVAAHCVLVGLVPGQAAVFDAALAASLARIPDGEPKVDGIAVGMMVAMKMLDWLSKDGSDAKESTGLSRKIGADAIAFDEQLR
jgi:hypothetical protein